MTKRILSFLLCLVLLFHTLPLNCFATSTSQTDPEIVAVRFFNDCTSDDYITISDASETLDIHFNSTDNPYKFEIEFTDPDKVSYVFVSSTVKGNEKSLDATYDETLGAFVTSGYFDPDDKCYEPSNVRIHYTLKPTAPAVGSTVDWDEVIGCLDPDLQTATVNNTESENGYTGDTYCIRCGNVILTGEVVPAIHVHSYTETVTPPTCNAQGFTTFTCSCSDSYVDNYVAATGHDYDNGIITKKPDCATAGVKTFICKNDSSHTYTESIPATGHSYNEIVTLPTCTEKGYTTHTCVCGDSYIDTYIDALGHTGGTATCTRKAICKNCNEYYGEFASHDYSTEWSHGNENGHWHECLHCSAHDKQVPHIPGAAATEKTAQWCTVCSYVITPALGHTCTADNQWHTNGTFHWHLCTSCGSWVNSKIHSYSDDADTSCNVCGYVRAVKIVPTTVPTEETLPVEETAVTEIPTASTVLPTFDEEEDFTSPAGNSETEDVHTTGIKTIIAVAAGIATVSSIAVLVFFLYKKRIFPR